MKDVPGFDGVYRALTGQQTRKAPVQPAPSAELAPSATTGGVP